jgi:hypothetical protein
MGGINTSKAASGISDFELIGFLDRSIARPYRAATRPRAGPVREPISIFVDSLDTLKHAPEPEFTASSAGRTSNRQNPAVRKLQR